MKLPGGYRNVPILAVAVKLLPCFTHVVDDLIKICLYKDIFSLKLLVSMNIPMHHLSDRCFTVFGHTLISSEL
jgi:hypothetical protein